MRFRTLVQKALVYIILLQAGLLAAQPDSLRISLDSLFRLAEKNSSQIMLSRVLFERSLAVVDDKKNDRLPTAGVTASAGYLTNVGVIGLGTMPSGFYDMPHFSNSYAIQAAWLLYSGGRLTLGIDIAEIENRIAALNVEKDIQGIHIILAGYYLDLYKAYSQKKVLEQNIALGEGLLEKINNRYAFGTALKTDLIRNELLVSTYELALFRLMDKIAVTNYNIVSMLALKEGTVLIPQRPEVPVQAAEQILGDSSDVLIGKGLADNPEYRQLGLRIDLAGKKARQVKASDYPQIELFAGATFVRPYTFDIPAKDIYAYNNAIGIRLSYSINSLYQNQRKKDIAGRDTDIAILAQTLGTEALSREINTDYIRLQQSLTQLNTLYKQQELAQENYKRISDSYLEQLTLNTEVTDASNQKLEADLRVTEAEAEILFNYFQLLKSIGKL